MIPPVTVVRLSGARHRDELPVLVLGPALGTTATALWRSCARGLGDVVDVVAWDLPGHGHNRSVPEEPVTTADLAAGVLDAVDDLLTQRGEPRGSFWYAGCSLGGAVGLELALAAPDRVGALAVLGTGSHASAPEDAQLGGYDVRDRLARIAVPVLAVAGVDDAVTPPTHVRAVADGVLVGRYVELPGVGHLAPAEAPEEVAALLREHFLGEERAAVGLGDVDELLAVAATSDLWSRPGLGPLERSVVAITALAVAGRDAELEAALRDALAGGLSVDALREVLLQVAAYAGPEVGGAAFRTAARVLSTP